MCRRLLALLVLTSQISPDTLSRVQAQSFVPVLALAHQDWPVSLSLPQLSVAGLMVKLDESLATMGTKAVIGSGMPNGLVR